VVELAGGPARARVLLLFGAVLALSGADAATVGAVAPQLEHSLHIGNAKVGLLSSVGLLVGAVFVIPVGMLVDRSKRMPMLSISVALWSLASLFGAFASSYWHLLLWRLALGAVTATAGPAIASLTGDYFPARERGRVYAYILAGETAGTAVGFIISGTLASIISWRAAFVALAIPGFFLARELWRTVPEPDRAGQSRLQPGAVVIQGARAHTHREPGVPMPHEPDDVAPEPATKVDQYTDAPGYSPGDPPGGTQRDSAGGFAEVDAATGEPEQRTADADLARVAAEARGIKPDPQRVLREDPRKMSLLDAVRYTLRIPTNLLMIIGSSLGYFYFAGLSTFALLFVRGHYHVGQATSELGLGLLVGGALIGTLISGQLTDVMLRRGMIQARIWVPAACYLAAVICFIPGILGNHLTPALWFDVAGAAFVSAANAPLQAAKLDIMPAGLWGRAESTRTLVRSLAQALAPLLFGGVADLVAGIVPQQTPVGTHTGLVSSNTATGLEVSFLIMLAALVLAAVALFRAGRTYATDVATAAASHQGTPLDETSTPTPTR
jgi:MFS family permease